MKRLIILMLLVASTTAIFAQSEKEARHKKKEISTAKAIYSCPTHPDVTSTKPGKCSKCGTELVVQRTGSKQVGEITYTCPMHPDVVSDKAGNCPKCGMGLTEKKGTSNSKTKM